MDQNKFAEAELNGDFDNYFDFEAASFNEFLPGTQKNLARQTQTIDDGKCKLVVPMTESEIEAFLAMRASTVQNSGHSDCLTPAQLSTESRASRAWVQV